MSALDFGPTTIMMVLFFGANALLFAMFQMIYMTNNSGNSNSNQSSRTTELSKKEGKDHAAKELSKPFTGTIDCFTNITTELFRTGLIMMITYVCEKHWLFEHSGKQYSRDLFMFILIVFFAYGFYTIKPVHDLTLLSREQTEEWKGWMQFIFLLYHYFHAEEVYNSVRVMITCYVWMTGFGNFQFFYVKQDFGWLRVVQMLWRLNFSVILLMWTHGNTWILYYICPMHTFYFFMVYLTMSVLSSVNHSKWGIRVKLFIVGVIIYLIWDINRGTFDFLFAWLGTDSVIGATNGSVWEYYFRTSLDHWSSFLGMIFAINFPLAEQYFYKARGNGSLTSSGPLIIAAVVMGAASIWWAYYIYPLPKLDYNLVHSYYAIIPLTAYIFFRNITPTVRSGHHVWLTSNAKTLLTIVPGHPWINFALATILFFTLSKELYRLTMSLRGMILPEDKNLAFVNSIGLILIFVALYPISLILHSFQASLLEIFLVSLGLALIAILFITRFARQTADNAIFQHWSRRVAIIVFITLVVGLSLQFAIDREFPSPDPNSWESTKYNADASCFNAISKGHWSTTPCDPELSSSLDRKAFCETDQWVWDGYAATCPVANISPAKAKSLLKGKKVIFVGDSIVRNTYHQLNKLLNPKYDQMLFNSTYKHASLGNTFPGNISIAFVWQPMTQNVTSYLQQIQAKKEKVDILIIGATVHDALYDRNINSYVAHLKAIQSLLPASNKTVKIWLQPTAIVDSRLSAADKQLFMTEASVSTYRKAVETLPGMISGYGKDSVGSFHNIINPTLVSKGKETSSADGIHYGEEVYAVIVQMIANTVAMQSPSFYSGKPTMKKGAPKPTGIMSKPDLGAAILLLSFIMLVTMDGFLGLGYFSLLLFGRSFDWESAFDPIHKKLGLGRHAVSTPDPVALEEKESLIESGGSIELSSHSQGSSVASRRGGRHDV